ncbi:MAG: type 1 glutamine amidotransferase [Paracoccaceae bacterium]
MKIGILETGEAPEELRDKHGDYPSMFAQMLMAHAPDLEVFTIHTHAGDMPASPDMADGWVITGSRHGVYDDLPWIKPLKTFLRACVADKIPVAGICFGHQILAEALGGRVEKSDKGWGLGVHEYVTKNPPAWMKGFEAGFAGHAIHQDQIVELPAESSVIACSDFCEYAALVYGDPEKPFAISVQSHPEFSTGFVDDLVRLRMGKPFPKDTSAHARKTLGEYVHNEEWGGWISRFLELAARPPG